MLSRILTPGALAVGLALAAAAATAQPYPTTPVSVVVPFGAGVYAD
jgi:tripartite-type tricarboxylate transporter receptor subunit TctC